jgi:hypothetical protein
MKVIFLIPLKSEEISRDWNYTVALALRCLDSVFNQSSDSFKVVLSCNRFPYDSTSNNLEIVERDHPIPENWEAGHKDKYNKIKQGLIVARESSPCYIMKLDADDLVHKDLVSHVLARGKDGYFINKGYIYADGCTWIQKLNKFHGFCGSSNLIRVNPKELPESMEQDSKSFDILCCGHNIFEEFYQSRGKHLYSIPFRSAVYVSATGENHSGHDIKNLRSSKAWLLGLLKRRPLGARLRNKFCLKPLSNYIKHVQQGDAPNALPLRGKT